MAVIGPLFGAMVGAGVAGGLHLMGIGGLCAVVVSAGTGVAWGAVLWWILA